MGRLPLVLALAAIGAQIAFPLAHGAMLDAVTAAVVILLAACALVHALLTRGARFTLAFVTATVGAGFLAEAVGVATGFPFGCYQYDLDRLGPSLADVPLIVPLAWAAGSYPVWCAASVVTARYKGTARTALRVPLTALTITAWDLYLDPQMVTIGYWEWCPAEHVLPGVGQIPLTNFAGWLLIAFIIAVTLELAERSRPIHPQPRMDAVPLLLFMWTWLGSALAHAVFLNLRFPDAGLQYSAIFGVLGMAITGVPLVISLLRSIESRTRATRHPAGQPTATDKDLAR